MSKLIIVGAGGHARETLWLAKAVGNHEILGFAADNEAKGASVCDHQILGSVEDLVRQNEGQSDLEFVIAVGDPRTRMKIANRMLSLDREIQYATLVHPSVLQSSYVEIGPGSMVSAGVILTTQVVIGRHVILNVGAACGHDVTIGDFVTVGPKAQVSGGVTAGTGAEIAAGVIVRQGVKFGVGSMAAMGSMVMKSVHDYSFVVGNPARPMKELERLDLDESHVGLEY